MIALIKSEEGFTLMETVIAFSLLSVMMVAVVQSYVMFQSQFTDSSLEVNLHKMGRQTLDKITREVRGARVASVAKSGDDTTLTVTRFDGNDVIFVYEDDNKVIQYDDTSDGVASQVMLLNVDEIGATDIFSYVGSNGLQINYRVADQTNWSGGQLADAYQGSDFTMTVYWRN